MNKVLLLIGVCFVAFAMSCDSAKSPDPAEQNPFQLAITQLGDQAYPDNPDIGFRASEYDSAYFESASLTPTAEFQANFEFKTKEGSLRLDSILLFEFIPTIPNGIKGDASTELIAVVNQEWNRNQVSLSLEHFQSADSRIKRVDLARNCLRSGLWECIPYIEEQGKQQPLAHLWFEFPMGYYQALFDAKNDRKFVEFEPHLVEWKDLPNAPINLASLRTIQDSLELTFADLSQEMYPIAGAREKKFKEVISPSEFNTMKQLQTDSSRFATFSEPGFYNRQAPRKTELGRFNNLDKVWLKSNTTESSNVELDLEFTHSNGSTKTHFVLGGVDWKKVPTLPAHSANQGWKSSMGIGNHPFYEGYEEHLAHQAKENSYYALLLDHEGRFLDSHLIGVDGPLLHFDDAEPNLLHLWILSFERHALIGHYTIDLSETVNPTL